MCWVLYCEKGMAVMHWWCCSRRGPGSVCVSMSECSMVASAHHSEWNRVGSVLSTMRQQWQQPSARQTGPALPSTEPLSSSSSSGLKPLVFLQSCSKLPQRPQGGKETQAALTACSSWTDWLADYNSGLNPGRTHAVWECPIILSF